MGIRVSKRFCQRGNKSYDSILRISTRARALIPSIVHELLVRLCNNIGMSALLLGVGKKTTISNRLLVNNATANKSQARKGSGIMALRLYFIVGIGARTSVLLTFKSGVEDYPDVRVYRSSLHVD